MKTEGYELGDVCNRNGCIGVIAQHEKEGSCSCHINPPCDSCTTAREYCPACDWSLIEEQRDSYVEPSDEQKAKWAQEQKAWQESRERFYALYRSKEPVKKFDYRSEAHTHFTMKKIGYYPPEMTQADVLKEVRGTFGGRFDRFENGRFEYTAYTD